jgi:hypothetical protein
MVSSLISKGAFQGRHKAFICFDGVHAEVRLVCLFSWRAIIGMPFRRNACVVRQRP